MYIVSFPQPQGGAATGIFSSPSLPCTPCLFHNSKGVMSQSPALADKPTLGDHRQNSSTPTGLRLGCVAGWKSLWSEVRLSTNGHQFSAITPRLNPYRVVIHREYLPRVGPMTNPGLKDATPVGLSAGKLFSQIVMSDIKTKHPTVAAASCHQANPTKPCWRYR